MKKKFYSLLLASFFIVGIAHAQDILLESFDDPAAASMWINSTAGDYTLTASADAAEGSGSVDLAYNLVGDQGWGGSVDMTLNPAGTFFDDVSATEGISFWYKVLTPASGDATWNTKLIVESTGGDEEWHAALGGVLTDNSGEWVKGELYFSGFAIPSWLTTYDGVLYLNKIKSIVMQITTAEGVTTTGEILIDGLSTFGGGGGDGTLLESFDDPAVADMWINSTAGDFTLTGSSDAAEGTGSVDLAYNLVGDQGWGGSVDMTLHPSDTYFPDISAAEGISFWYKVLTPASGDATWNTKLIIESTGGDEEWHAALDGVLTDNSGEWVKGELYFSGFAIPSWLTTYDGVLYLDKIKNIVMQITTAEGVTTTGEILIDGLEAFGGGGITIGSLLESFDATGGIETTLNSNAGSYFLTSSLDAVEGEGSVCLDYILVADQDWGGSVDLGLTPMAPDTIYPDISEDAGIRFNYKVTQPASSTDNVVLNVKLFVSSAGGTAQEEWHAALSGVIDDDSGEWQEAKLPFVNFSIPSWLPTFDGVLHLDKILRIEVQIVSSTMGNDSNGTICFDNLTSYSEEDITIYEGYPLNNFNFPSTVDTWINSDSVDSYHYLTATTDAIEGDSAACLSYNLIADLGWGGSVDMQFLPQGADTVFSDMTDHLGVSFWYKNNQPADIPGNVSFIVKALVNSTGGTEEWHKTVGGILADPSGEWTQVFIPFSSFAIPNWVTHYDEVFYLDRISEFQFQISGQPQTTTMGEICFDNFTSYDDEEVIIIINTVEPVDPSVKVYPNPTSTRLNIDGLENIQRIEVYSLNGSLVQSFMSENSIDVSALHKGYYFLKIYTDKDVYSSRFLKH